MKTYLAMAAALAGCTPALAEPTRMLMPEGSKDVYLSLAAAIVPRAEGSAEQQLRMMPLISAQWANGVFINMNTVGIHLSEQTNMEYGFTLAPSFTRTSTLTDSGRQSTRRFTPEAGAFFNYQVAYGMELASALMYGGSSDHRGLRMNLGAQLSLPVAEHHGLGVGVGLQLANRAALQADYGVSAQQARANLAAHDVSGGLRRTALSASWRWQISNKYSLASALEASRLHGSAASSPRIEQANGVSLSTVLTYRY